MLDFTAKYSAAAVAKLRAKGASDEAIAAKKKEMEQFEVMYDNPLMNVAMPSSSPSRSASS